MKPTCIFILVFVLVETLLLIEVSALTLLPTPRCVSTGSQCKSSADCCKDNCCVKGICQNEKGKCNPCDEVVCEDFEICQVLKNPNCKGNMNPCKKTPQCVSVADPCSQYPRPPECIHKELCSNYTCPEGEQCYFIGEDCPPGDECYDFIVASPVCRNPDSCNKTICSAGFKCVNVLNGYKPPYPECQIEDDPCQYLSCPDPSKQCYINRKKCHSYTSSTTTSTSIAPICAPSNPCNGVVCREGYMCIIVEDGYYQPFAQCVPNDNVCAYTICDEGESCIVLKRYPPKPVCTPGDIGTQNPLVGNPCDGIVCKENEKCYYEKTCMKTSCYLEPRCNPSNPCDSIKCSDDYFCHVYNENGLPIARCTPYSDPCAFTVCTEGATCEILESYPVQLKCSEPDENSPCYSMKCPQNTKCETYSVNGTLQAKCVYIRSPCNGLICPVNEPCIVNNYDYCGNIPIAHCGSSKLCDNFKCPEDTHYCQEFSLSEAFCVPLIKNPCENFTCPDGQKCYIYDTDSLSIPFVTFCTDTDLCRINVCSPGYECVTVDQGIFSPQGKCVPLSNSCENVACPEFQQCYLESPYCLMNRRRLQQPVCTYSNPCNHISCPNGTICSRIQEGNSPPKAQCILISDPCYGVQCPEHQKCYFREVQCVRAPCPPIAECAYYDPCMITECGQYYKCEERQNGNEPPTAECVVDYEALCSGVICLELKKCYLQDVTCITSPCPPQPVCDYYNPCMLAKCSGGHKCVVQDNGYYPPKSKCVPDRDSVCEGTVCPADQKCYLQACETESCPPAPECAYETPCTLVDCASGYMCHEVDHGDYPPKAECVLDPNLICSYHPCPLYQKCYLMEVFCKKSPCYPEPVCSYPDPCLFATCDEGYKCVVIEVKPKPPTAYCMHNYDLCFGVNCEIGYSCYVKDMECTDLDCYPVPPKAVCSLTDPCAGKLCPINSHCEVKQLPRNNPPEARCVQPESPCDNMLCESGYWCYIKDYECNETGCFDIVPVGVCALPDPCIASLCITGTACLAVQIRRNPPQPLCGSPQFYDPCDRVLCEGGQQCYVKDVECSDFGCNAVYPTAECSDPNPCLTIECIGNTVCVVEQTRNNPPLAQCKPPRTLCEEVTCSEGEQCYVIDQECNESGCQRLTNPYAQCAVSNPCLTTLCLAISACFNVHIRNNPPQPVCIRTPSGNECQGVRCSSGYKCYVKDIECDEFTCDAIEPVGVCSLIQPCRVVRCAGRCVEVQERDNPPEASCQPIDYCNNVNCTEGEKCFVKDFSEINILFCNENGECRRSYNQPTGVCANTNPCSYTLCETGTLCLVQQVRNNPPFAMCASMGSPCDMVDCMPSNWCYVKDFECDKYSCRLIKPEAVCAPSDPCYNTSCLANSVCIPSQIRRNPQTANCVSYSQLCNNVHCADGEKCYIVQVFCIRAPCPPQPMCLPADQCATKTCLPGYTCVSRHYGVGPPFAECVKLDDPCDGLNCADGQKCYLREKLCLCPPCGYEPVCAYPNPCILALCPEGHGCYAKSLGRLEPLPVCYPTDNPCKVYECLPGQECRITKIACQPHLPCPVPVCTGDPTNHLCHLAGCGPGYECVVDMEVTPLIAKCVPHDDPCDYTICPEGSLCVIQEKYPPVGRCTNISGLDPCFVVRCKKGYQCVHIGTDPTEAECRPTCDICPPTTDCIVHQTYPQIIGCNPNPKWLITYSP